MKIGLETAKKHSGPTARERQIPRSVVALGVVSLLMDMSSELIHSLLPVYLVAVMGVGALTLGIIEGVAESATSILKVFSGVISDFSRRRKPLLVIGYGLAAISKPLFPLASTYTGVFAARLIDRIGKGLRGAPRDALIADVTPGEIRGAAFGLRQAMDTSGAFLGPVLAVVLMLALHGNYRLVFWLAAIPAMLAVLVLVFAVREPARGGRSAHAPRINWHSLSAFPRAYWWLVAIGICMTLARFSEAFLLLRAVDLGVSAVWVPVVLVVMNIFYAGSAFPFGRIADRLPPINVLALGMTFLLLADILLAMASAQWTVFAGVAIWGLHMGATQGVLAAMIAHVAPADLRASAFGIFNLFAGLALLLASVIAGAFWQFLSPAATFAAGAVLSLLTLGLLWWRRASL